jgi:predicted alpha/beta superfamily hydrolase
MKQRIILTFYFGCLFILSINAQTEQSVFKLDSIWSENLQEYRKITIYLPPKYTENKLYPVIYTTDGQLINNNYKLLLDSLINNQHIIPIVLIGVYSNEKNIEKSNLSYRNFEYLQYDFKNDDNPLFSSYENHLKFFSFEMINYIESRYNVSKSPSNRVFYGCSNGAAFGLSLSYNKNEFIENYILASPIGIQFPLLQPNKHPINTSYYISYGSQEIEGVINSTENLVSEFNKENH